MFVYVYIVTRGIKQAYELDLRLRLRLRPLLLQQTKCRRWHRRWSTYRRFVFVYSGQENEQGDHKIDPANWQIVVLNLLFRLEARDRLLNDDLELRALKIAPNLDAQSRLGCTGHSKHHDGHWAMENTL